MPNLEDCLSWVPFPSPAGTPIWRHTAILVQSRWIDDKSRIAALTTCVQLCPAGTLCFGPTSSGPLAKGSPHCVSQESKTVAAVPVAIKVFGPLEQILTPGGLFLRKKK